MKIFGVCMVKYGYGQSCDRTLKLTVFEKWADGINWIYACQYRLTKIKSWSKVFLIGLLKNGCRQSGSGNLKLTLSKKKRQMEETNFLHAGTNSGKLKAESLILGGCSHGHGLLVHEALKSTLLSWFFKCW